MKTKINAQIVAHSVNEQGDELISVLATFPRIILAEINTHRMLSKNTSSSRAIPFNKMVETVKNDPFIPIAWQKEHKGMQGTKYFEKADDVDTMNMRWLVARDKAVETSKWLNNGLIGDEENVGVTKQLCNRLLEPFMWTTMIITGPKSGWENFFNLRCPSYELTTPTETLYFKSKIEYIRFVANSVGNTEAINLSRMSDLDWLKVNKGQAEIHMMALAECIWDAYNESTPKVLKAGEWHIPFLNKISSDVTLWSKDTKVQAEMLGKDLTENFIKVSVAMAARTSYTVVGEEKTLDYEAMIGLHDRLLAWDPPHSSPLEHCARAMSNDEYYAFKRGWMRKTNLDQESGWCNNFKGFIPYRYMVDNGNQKTED